MRRIVKYKIEDVGIAIISVTSDDAEMIYERLVQSDIHNLSFFSSPLTVERERDYLRRMADSPGDYLFIIMRIGHDGEEVPVGTIGLHEHDTYNNTARLGIIIFSEFQGMGLSSKAIKTMLDYGFNRLQINKVYLNVFAKNTFSQNIYTKIGFSRDGIRREHYRLKGVYHDMTEMSILRGEWNNIARKEN